MLDKYGIHIEGIRHKMVIKCPKCGDKRKNRKGVHTLQLYNDEDGIRFRCFNDNCEYSKVTFIPNDSIGFVKPEVLPEPVFVSIPEDTSLPIDNNKTIIKYPYKNIKGEILFYICRTVDKKFFPLSYDGENFYFSKPPIKALYGAENLNKSDKVIIVEGEKAANAGKDLFPNSVVITWANGANAIDKGDWELIQDKTVMYLPDNDEAGLNTVSELIKFLPLSNTILVADVSKFPEKGDIADLLELTKEERKIILNHAFDNAKDYTQKEELIRGQLDLEELEDNLLNFKEGVSLGWSNTDKYITYPPSGLVVIQGRTNHGKSAFMINSCAKLVTEKDYTCVYLSYEMPATQIALRFIKMFNNSLFDADCGFKDNKLFIEAIKNNNLKGYDIFKDVITRKKLLISDTNITISEVCKSLDNLYKKGERNVVVFLDYLQLIPSESRKDQRYLELKSMVEMIRQKVNDYGYVLVAGSQLTSGETPYADQSRESKDITFTAELVLKIWNKVSARTTGTYKETKEGIIDYYNDTIGDFIIDVVKSRQSRTGLHFGFNLEGGSIMREVKQIEENSAF